MAPQIPQCVEAGCDRPATEGDERCELHQVRLGARPSRPSKPPAPRPAVSSVIVESALDASVAVPPARVSRNRDYWLGVRGWALGAAAFFGSVVLVIGWDLQFSRPAKTVLVALWFASGALATFGAGKSTFATKSLPKSVLAALLAAATGFPTLLVLYALAHLLLSEH
ncbi:MAG TPA: hypothetical protein VGK67_32505 [Myxococcales bacterium]